MYLCASRQGPQPSSSLGDLAISVAPKLQFLQMRKVEPRKGDPPSLACGHTVGLARLGVVPSYVYAYSVTFAHCFPRWGLL